MARRNGGAPRSSATAMRRRVSTIEHTDAQNAVYAAPWLLLLLAAVAGQILHALYASNPAFSGLTILGILVGTAALCWAGWVSTHERSRTALTHTLVTVVISGCWMIFCAVTGLVELEAVDGIPIRLPIPQRPTLDLWIIVGGVLCLVWNMRQGVRVSEARAASLAGEISDDWTEAGFPGVKGSIKRKNKYRSEGTLTIPKGMHIELLQKGARSIESAFDWPPNSVTLLPTRLSSRKVHIRIMHENPLDCKIEWPGVDA